MTVVVRYALSSFYFYGPVCTPWCNPLAFGQVILYPCPWKYRFREKITVRVVLTVLKVTKHNTFIIIIFEYNIITRICDILLRSSRARVTYYSYTIIVMILWSVVVVGYRITHKKTPSITVIL
jgi:hypothetical protein